jgi:hypothetical protein
MEKQIETIDSIEFFKRIKKFLKNPLGDYTKICFGQHVGLPYFISISPKINILNEIREDKINLVMQFYIDKNNERQKEIRQTLYLNTKNNSIDKIYLLNERQYTDEELGISNDKIVQIILNKRLTFKHVFDFVENYKIDGYIVLANSDIFFDKSIEKVKICDFTSKNMLTLCRYEYDGISDLKDCKLFDNGRPDSQDTWVFHSSINVEQKYRNLFNFMLGKPGCDNKLIYLLQIIGYQCYNEAKILKSYHNHSSGSRNYNIKEKIPPPYCVIYPTIEDDDIPSRLQSFNIIQENDVLCDYIKSKINSGKHFVIPRIAGIENQIAYAGVLLKQTNINIDMNSLQKMLNIMKNNAGIKISNLNSLDLYSTLYIEPFHQCDIYTNWEFWGDVTKSIYDSANFMHINFQKPKIWAFTLDIFNHIQTRLWTRELKGKRILIISPFVESFKKKLDIREKIYGIDLFPDCNFVFLKPPQTQADCPSREFIEELNDFVGEINKIINDFDVALVSCGGYGNLVCAQIYSRGKSAIYVGGVLQMYFGVYGNRWERERPEIMSLYKNEYWTRPEDEERPVGFQNVENSCYW